MKRAFSILTVVLMAELSGYAQGQDQEDLKLLEPLLNIKVPVLALWYCPAKDLPQVNSEKIYEFVYRKLFDRFDVKLLSRKAQEEKLATLDPRLRQCGCSSRCLEALGRALESQRVIGVIVSKSASGFRLTIQSLILSEKDTRQLNSVVEGNEKMLLGGALEKALAAIFENESYHAPVVDKSPVAKATRPSPAPAPRPRQVEVVPPAPLPSTTVQVAKPAPGFFSRHRWSLLAGGLALGSLAGAIALGVMSQQIADEQHIQYDPDKDATGRNFATAANALFGVSAGAALGAVLLFFLVEDTDSAKVAVEPLVGGAQLSAVWCW